MAAAGRVRRERPPGRGLLALAGCVLTLPALALTHNPVVAAASTAQPKPVLAWGTNIVGEDGNGGSGNQYGCCGNGWAYNDYPVQTAGIAGAVAVSAGVDSSAAIVPGYASDGTADPARNTVWTWGDDYYGQLGARPDVCLIPAVGYGNGVVPYGIGGYQHEPCAKQPVEVRGPGGVGTLTGIVAIAAGGTHVLALREDGTVWGWGDDGAEELGATPPSSPNPACPTAIDYLGGTHRDASCVPYPVRVAGLSGVTAIAANQWYSAAIAHHGGSGPDDTVWVWGDNRKGELGQGWDCSQGPWCGSPTPTAVPGLSGVVAVSAGSADDIMAIVRGQAADGSDNQLWTWGGENEFGESGVNIDGVVQDPSQGFAVPIDRPERVLDASGTGYFTGAVAVSTNGDSTVALKYDPALGTTTVWNWGDGTPAASGTPSGPLVGENYIWTTPRQVRGANGNGFLTGATSVAMAGGSAYALLSDGSVWSWGDASWGELAWPSSELRPDGQPFSTFPVQARGVAGATAIAAGWAHVVALAASPPAAPVEPKQQDSATPPPLPFEQLSTTAAPIQPPQAPATVPVVNPGVAASTVNPPQPPAPGGNVSGQPGSLPVHAASPAHAPTAQTHGTVASSQLVAGTAGVPGSPGALAPSVGHRPTANDQLAMLRHDDAAEAAWAAGLAGVAVGAAVVCLVAMARSRRPPAARPARAWAGAGRADLNPRHGPNCGWHGRLSCVRCAACQSSA